LAEIGERKIQVAIARTQSRPLLHRYSFKPTVCHSQHINLHSLFVDSEMHTALYVASLCALAVALDENKPAVRKLILDFDPGGLVYTSMNLDDDLGYIMLTYFTRRERIRILGTTVTYGNAPLVHTAFNAKVLRELTGTSSYPQFNGAELGSRNLSKPTAASQYLVTTLKNAAPRSVDVLCWGPLTNLATAMIETPSIQDGIRSVWIVGGDLNNDAFVHVDINLLADKHATDIVLSANVPKFMIAAQTALQVAFTSSDFSALTQNCPSSAVCEYRLRLQTYVTGAVSRSFASALYWSAAYHPYRSPRLSQGSATCLWDWVAAGVYLHPEMWTGYTTYKVEMKTLGMVSTRLGEPTNWEAIDTALQKGPAHETFAGLTTSGTVIVPMHVYNETQFMQRMIRGA
jgi:inosine-uridine nucleoside N-ribohydrolase